VRIPFYRFYQNLIFSCFCKYLFKNLNNGKLTDERLRPPHRLVQQESHGAPLEGLDDIGGPDLWVWGHSLSAAHREEGMEIEVEKLEFQIWRFSSQ